MDLDLVFDAEQLLHSSDALGGGALRTLPGDDREPRESGAAEREAPGGVGRSGKVAPAVGRARERLFDDGGSRSAPRARAPGVGRDAARRGLADESLDERGHGRLAPLYDAVEVDPLVEGRDDRPRHGDAHEAAVLGAVGGVGVGIERTFRRSRRGCLRRNRVGRRRVSRLARLRDGRLKLADGEAARQGEPGGKRRRRRDPCDQQHPPAPERSAAIVSGERSGETLDRRERVVERREITHPSTGAPEMLPREIGRASEAEGAPGSLAHERRGDARQRHGEPISRSAQ